jgi:muramoyltetrapeptide carboxypeptidase
MPAHPQKPRIKPPALRPGDAIGIAAPASNINRGLFEQGCNVLRDLGYRTVFLDSIFERDLYFAGTLDRRVRELEDMFSRDDVRAILCARGGYGSNYLLGKLDPSKIISHPKIFVGYSDLTSLLTCFCDSAGFVTFHGPMLTKDFAAPGGVDLASWNAAVTGDSGFDVIPVSPVVKTLAAGDAEGVLYGGCLSILVASLGTPHEIQTDDTILFLEDLNAKPYQIDRMLVQLRLAGKLNRVRGFVFGEMLDCIQTANQDYTLEEVVLRVIGDLGVPIAWGLRSGHVTGGNVTLPFGVHAALHATVRQVSLKILEPAAKPAAVPTSVNS